MRGWLWGLSGIIDSYELGAVPAAKVYKLGKAVCHPDAQAWLAKHWSKWRES
jgi:hypothetical protein